MTNNELRQKQLEHLVQTSAECARAAAVRAVAAAGELARAKSWAIAAEDKAARMRTALAAWVAISAALGPSGRAAPLPPAPYDLNDLCLECPSGGNGEP